MHAPTRRRSREMVLQALYALEMNPGERPESIVESLWNDLPGDEASRSFARELLDGVRRAREEIDETLARASTHWKLDRMGKVDSHILRIAAYEILHRDEIPAEVSIDEAVELAKRFGTEESAAFVNGILDRVARESGKLEAGANRTTGSPGEAPPQTV